MIRIIIEMDEEREENKMLSAIKAEKLTFSEASFAVYEMLRRIQELLALEWEGFDEVGEE